MADEAPLVIGFSGKRFAGKDTLAKFVTEYISSEYPSHTYVVFPLASAFKLEFAQQHMLDFEKLLHDREYKESHRKQMNEFFQRTFPTDPRRFCRAALAYAKQKQANVLIITDVRLKSDVKNLTELAQGRLVLIRVQASDAKRNSFGWVFDAIIDEHKTEIDLDSYDTWNRVIDNNGSLEDLKAIAKEVVNQSIAAK